MKDNMCPECGAKFEIRKQAPAISAIVACLSFWAVAALDCRAKSVVSAPPLGWSVGAVAVERVAQEVAGTGLNTNGWDLVVAPDVPSAAEEARLTTALAGRGVRFAAVREAPPCAGQSISGIVHAVMRGGPVLLSGSPVALPPPVRKLISNPEVVAIAHDPLCAGSAGVACVGGEAEVRPLADGSFALALYNRSGFEKVVSLSLDALGVEGYWLARDLLARRDEGQYSRCYSTRLGAGEVRFARLYPRAMAKVSTPAGDIRYAQLLRRPPFPDAEDNCEHCRSRRGE